MEGLLFEGICSVLDFLGIRRLEYGWLVFVLHFCNCLRNGVFVNCNVSFQFVKWKCRYSDAFYGDWIRCRHGSCICGVYCTEKAKLYHIQRILQTDFLYCEYSKNSYFPYSFCTDPICGLCGARRLFRKSVVSVYSIYANNDFGRWAGRSGWRGVLQPLLEKHFSFLPAAVIEGVIWSVWHLPLWLVPNTSQGDYDFTAFTLYCITLGLTLAEAYRLTKSIWVTILIHAWGNTVLGGMYTLTSLNNFDRLAQ